LKPIKQIATATTPDGSVLILNQHDNDFTINVDRQELMSSRRHESEVQLAKLGCRNMTRNNQPCVLIGGLGMGYTLRATLDMLKPGATITVAELVPEVVKWNRKYLGELTDNALNDKRVTVKTVDVVELLKESSNCFDSILLDIDNGPAAITNIANARLYNRNGIKIIMNALKEKGCVAFWSSGRDKTFERRLRKFGLVSRFFKVPVYKGAKACPVCILVASREFSSLPPLPPAKIRENKE
jgi:spermidine synthase